MYLIELMKPTHKRMLVSHPEYTSNKPFLPTIVSYLKE